jgi:nucleoside-diphosphate-sugar epimerase
MRVFVAGGAGAMRRCLVPRLVARGHQVTATAAGPAELAELARLGARGVMMDGLDAVSVGETVGAARSDAIVHQVGAAHTGASAVRLGTDHLLAAAEATGVPYVVAQSTRDAARPRTRAEALRYAEHAVVRAGGAVLRHGRFYGPGAAAEPVHHRRFPLVGGGACRASWVHLDDAATATVLAVERKAAGVFDIVDDGPGAFNARAKRELGWRPRHRHHDGTGERA